MQEASIPRMRTAAKVIAEIKALDPDSDVTEYCIRQMIKDGVVPVLKTGNKALVNLDDVLALLRVGSKPTPAPAPGPATVGGIRRINV